jgi:hypothetical protein
MFRVTIRELLLVILAVGLTLGWVLDRRAVAEQRDRALEDAMFLAQFSEFGGGCGIVAANFSQLREKYIVMRSVVGYPMPKPLIAAD